MSIKIFLQFFYFTTHSTTILHYDLYDFVEEQVTYMHISGNPYLEVCKKKKTTQATNQKIMQYLTFKYEDIIIIYEINLKNVLSLKCIRW